MRSRPLSSLKTMSVFGSPFLTLSWATLVIPVGMSSSDCLAGHDSIGSGGNDVEMTWRGCGVVRMHLLLFASEAVISLLGPSVVSCL